MWVIEADFQNCKDFGENGKRDATVVAISHVYDLMIPCADFIISRLNSWK